MIAFIYIVSFATPDLFATEVKKPEPTAMYDQDGNLTHNVHEAYWPPVNNNNGQNNQWKGVGQLLRNGKPGCTVNLIQIPNCPKPKKPQVVTNGHCVDRGKNFEVKFGLFADSKASDHTTVRANTLYSSYFNKDIAIMELDTDYDSLVRVIKPFEIAREPIRQSSTYDTVGIPLDKVPDHQQYLRQGVCKPAGANRTVVNERYLWDNELAFIGCSVRGGASGSGLFNNGKLHGLLHAGAVTDGDFATMKDPCVIDTCTVHDNKPRREIANFGYDVTNLHDCYQDCQLNTKLPGCLLPDPESKIAFDVGSSAASNVLTKKFKIESHFAKFQVKGCTSDPACSCDDPSGYQTHEGNTISGAPFFNDGATYNIKPNAPAEFRYLCVRGQNADGTIDARKNLVKLPLHLRNFKPIFK